MHVLAANGWRREVEGVRDRIIEAHQWLVVACARRMQRSQEPLDDLVQAGCLGLIRAVDRFDARHGVPFRTYATATVMGELRHHRRTVWRLRTARTLQETSLRVARARDELTAVLRRTPTADDVARHLGISVELVLEALDASTNQVPLSFEASGEVGHRGTRVAPGHEDPAFEAMDSTVTVRALLAALPALEREAVFLRYFHDLTQEQIGQRLGISQVAVSRIVQSAMEQMRGERTRPVRRRSLRATA